MNTAWYVAIFIALVIIGAVITSFLSNWYTKRPKSLRYTADHQFDRMSANEATFEERVKASGMKTATMVTCGPNTFAYDREKGKLLIQTQQLPEGVLLHSRDVLGYSLLRDGQTVAERSREGGEGIAGVNLNCDCERIELCIETSIKDYPQIELVLMPLRFEKAEARASAIDAARRIVEALDEVLGERA